MISVNQFEKSKQFIYRHGRLLDRKRFEYHFAGNGNNDVLLALSAYQNKDGGFGNGLELDVMCPQSTPISAEVALGIMIECDLSDKTMLDKLEQWVYKALSTDGRLPNPIDEIKKYPHGEWWLSSDDNRILSIAGYLSRFGRGTSEFYNSVTEHFRKRCIPFPDKINVYDYPCYIYFQNAPHQDQFQELKASFSKAIGTMLEQDAWHCPLFFCSDRWHSKDIVKKTWEEQAKIAVSMLNDDGGVLIKNYEQLPWWRPVWTLEMLVRMKKENLISF